MAKGSRLIDSFRSTDLNFKSGNLIELLGFVRFRVIMQLEAKVHLCC